MTRQRTLLLVVAAMVVLVAGGVVYALKPSDTAPAAGGVKSDKPATIRTSDGVTLAAEVVTPKGAAAPPLVVMPASWGQPQTEYRAVARNLAETGYLVVAYTQRGFKDSGGKVDFAGSRTQADARQVIDWALANTAADPKRIGMFGLSYGAGVSLLAAAKDPRIKVVAALSTWTDIGFSYDPNGTSSTRALATLLGSGGGGRFDSDVRRVQKLLKTKPSAVGAALRRLSPTRSPIDYVDALNRNKPAILLANGYQDSLFDPQQLVRFYDELTTPKRLQLAPGDHGGPEASGLTGARNVTMDAAIAWLDHYLRGTDNGIDTEDPIVLTDAQTGVIHTYDRWPTATASDTLRLGDPGSKKQTGPGGKRTWQAAALAGADTRATSGPAVPPFGRYVAPTIQLLRLEQGRSFAWTGPAVGTPTTIAGTPRVKLEVASTARTATIVAYLYDSDISGTGRLMSVQPYTLRGLTPRKARAITISMQPTAYTLPTGHRQVLVIDTVDPRYVSINPAGAGIVISATTAHPASLAAPASAK